MCFGAPHLATYIFFVFANEPGFGTFIDLACLWNHLHLCSVGWDEIQPWNFLFMNLVCHPLHQTFTLLKVNLINILKKKKKKISPFLATGLESFMTTHGSRPMGVTQNQSMLQPGLWLKDKSTSIGLPSQFQSNFRLLPLSTKIFVLLPREGICKFFNC